VPVARRSRRTLLAAVVVLATGAASCRTDRDVQRDYAKRLQPASLAAPEADPSRPIVDLPVRIYADDDYRSDLIHWRSRIEAQLERANRVLETQFGVRLVAKAVEPWERSGRARRLAETLDELAVAFPGKEGEWVIGFVSSSEVFSGSLEQLGMARMFGGHLVVRGMVSFQEGDAFRRGLDKLTEAERDALLHERELHREAVVLLHEWAHTLGAFHERDPDTIMSPAYGSSNRAFSAAAARVIQIGLARRTAARPAERQAWSREYVAEVERSRAAAWDEDTAARAIELGRALAAADAGSGARGGAAERRPGAAPRADEAPARAADAAALVQAELNDRLGDAARAWRLVEPIAARLPENAPLQQYACDLRRRALPRAAPVGPCRSAKPLGARAVALLFPRVLAELGERAGAAAAALRAEASFAAASPPPAPREWAELAALLSDLHACTVAERAAARAGAAKAPGALSRCARTRLRAALPARDSGVDPAREPEYVAAVLRGRDHATAGRVQPARTEAMAVAAAFPAAPGGPLVRCLAEAQGGDPAAARAACNAADRGPPWPYEPPYVLGMLAGWDGRWTEARDHLRRALERDDHDRELWARLAYAQEKLGARSDLDELAARYRARIGGTLRPRW
jgi:hypothetical protein